MQAAKQNFCFQERLLLNMEAPFNEPITPMQLHSTHVACHPLLDTTLKMFLGATRREDWQFVWTPFSQHSTSKGRLFWTEGWVSSLVTARTGTATSDQVVNPFQCPTEICSDLGSGKPESETQTSPQAVNELRAVSDLARTIIHCSVPLFEQERECRRGQGEKWAGICK